MSSVHSLLSLTVPVPPSPPSNVFIQSMDIGATFARICWQPPSSSSIGIPAVSRYVITVTQVNSTADPLNFNTTDATEDFNVTGLAPGTTYEFRVSAISESGSVVGQSGPSEPFTAATNFTGMLCVCACVCVCDCDCDYHVQNVYIQCMYICVCENLCVHVQCTTCVRTSLLDVYTAHFVCVFVQMCVCVCVCVYICIHFLSTCMCVHDT